MTRLPNPSRPVGRILIMNGQTEVIDAALAGSHGQPVCSQPKYTGVRVTCNGNQLVAQHVETRITEGGVFYPITPSTEGGEIYQQSYAQGELNVYGRQKVAIECEGEHAAQGGATAFSVTGRRGGASTLSASDRSRVWMIPPAQSRRRGEKPAGAAS